MIPTAIWYVLYHLNHFLWILEVGHFSRCMVGWVPEELLSETVQAVGFPILLSTWHRFGLQPTLLILANLTPFARKLSASLRVYFAFFPIFEIRVGKCCLHIQESMENLWDFNIGFWVTQGSLPWAHKLHCPERWHKSLLLSSQLPYNLSQRHSISKDDTCL